MDFIKESLNKINIKEETLYNIFYDLFFFAKLEESKQDISNGNYITLDEFKNYIDELEADNENNNME